MKEVVLSVVRGKGILSLSELRLSWHLRSIRILKFVVSGLAHFFFHCISVASSCQIQSVLGGEEAMEDSSELPNDPEQLQVVIEEAESQLAVLQTKIAEEDNKMERYKVWD